jgi:hypothetical protein
MRKWRWLLFVVLIAGALSACATPEAPEPIERGDSPLDSPLDVPDAESPVASPSPEAVEAPEVAMELRAKVAERMGLSADSLTALSVEPMTWRDASLGCPEPGKMYAQVLTDGYKVVYEDAGGDRIEVHAAEGLNNFVVCEDGAGVPAEQPRTPADQPAVQAAIRALAGELNVDAEAITVRSIEPREWRDSCLGCGRLNESCLTVITPGFQVMLEHDGEVYEMRTDRTGDNVRLCESGGA